MFVTVRYLQHEKCTKVQLRVDVGSAWSWPRDFRISSATLEIVRETLASAPSELQLRAPSEL